MFVLNEFNSIASQFINELRDVKIQKDRARFRKNLERLGEIMAYEISKSLTYESRNITTPLENMSGKFVEQQPVLISVMRAALPFFNGFLNYFDQADSGFVGAYRSSVDEKNFEIDFLYQATPSLEGKEIIVIDPMLATGRSFVTSISHLLKNGIPKKIHVASVIAAPEGIAYIQKNLNVPFEIWLGAVDQKLNEHAYIIPGLGDAGDLAFGPKIEK